MKATLALCTALLLSTALAACDPEQVSDDRVAITLFHRAGFGLPQTANAIAALRVTVVDRASGTRLSQETLKVDGAVGSQSATNIPFGGSRQVYVEALGAIGQSLASGATPPFTMLADTSSRTFLVYMAELQSMAPLSAIFRAGDGSPEIRPSPFMDGPRTAHTATALPDGRVLIAGGARLCAPDAGLRCAFGSCPRELANIETVFNTVEIFDPATGYFDKLMLNAATPFRLAEPRVYHTAETLTDGSVLLIGGLTINANNQLEASKTADLIRLNPDGSFALITVPLSQGRIRHASATTGNGNVVVTGGMSFDSSGELVALDSAEILAAGSQTFAPIENGFEGGRWDHTATAVGEIVMVAGGTNGTEVLGTTSVLVSGQFVPIGPMRTARYGHQTVHLSTDGGRYIVAAGGFTQAEDLSPTATFEVFDIQANKWVAELSAGSLVRARAFFDMRELPQGDLLVVGGLGVPAEGGRLGSLKDVELLVRQTSAVATFAPQALSTQLSEGRFGIASAALPSGMILISGGGRLENGGYGTYQLSDVFNPGPPLAVIAP